MARMNITKAKKVINYFKNVEPTCEECVFADCCSAMRCDLENAEKLANYYNNKMKELEDVFSVIEDLPNEPLDTAEKDYLIAVLKPFKRFEKAIRVMKCEHIEGSNTEYLYIWKAPDDNWIDDLEITFPPFKEGKKYKGLETEVAYTLEDLGIRL